MENIILNNIASVVENGRVYYTEEYVQNLRDQLEQTKQALSKKQSSPTEKKIAQ